MAHDADGSRNSDAKILAQLRRRSAASSARQESASSDLASVELNLPVPSLGELPGILTLPEGDGPFPAIVLVHGSGPNNRDEAIQSLTPFRDIAEGLAEKGVVAVFANYRVGVLGYLCHEELQRLHGRDGNFGLDDQLCAIRWVKAHIADFGGDGDNITIMGQSAGAIAVQLLCLNPENEGLFRHAVMLSGGGLFPKAGQPRRAEDTHAYWEQYMHLAGCRTLEQLRRASPEALFDASETMRKLRRDNVNNCMPVVDGKLIPAPVSELIRKPLKIDYWISYTNSDMFGPILAYVGNVFGKANGAYLCFFDLDAPGSTLPAAATPTAPACPIGTRPPPGPGRRPCASRRRGRRWASPPTGAWRKTICADPTPSPETEATT